MRKMLIFLKYHPLHQANVRADVLSYVTYVTAFKKSSDLVVKPAKSMVLYNMSKSIPTI